VVWLRHLSGGTVTIGEGIIEADSGSTVQLGDLGVLRDLTLTGSGDIHRDGLLGQWQRASGRNDRGGHHLHARVGRYERGVTGTPPQYPAPQRYCHATPTALNSLPVRVEMPVLALSLIEL